MHKEKEFLLYITVNKSNGKVYGGKHVGYKTDNYIGSGTAYFKNAVKKYGKDTFSRRWLRLKIKSVEELNSKETRLIRLLKYRYGVNCYNVHEGGSGGYHLMYYPKDVRDAVGRKIGNSKRQQYAQGATPSQIEGWKKRNEKMKLICKDITYITKLKSARPRAKISKALRIEQHGKTAKELNASKSLKMHGQFKLEYTVTLPNGHTERYMHSHCMFKLFHNIEDSVFILMHKTGECVIKRRTSRTKHKFPVGTIFKKVGYIDRDIDITQFNVNN